MLWYIGELLVLLFIAVFAGCLLGLLLHDWFGGNQKSSEP